MQSNSEQKEVRNVSIELNENEVQFVLSVIDNYQSKLSIFNEEHLQFRKFSEHIGHKIYNQVSAQLTKEKEEPKAEEENG